jgi:hypothetical protein
MVYRPPRLVLIDCTKLNSEPPHSRNDKRRGTGSYSPYRDINSQEQRRTARYVNRMARSDAPMSGRRTASKVWDQQDLLFLVISFVRGMAFRDIASFLGCTEDEARMKAHSLRKKRRSHRGSA